MGSVDKACISGFLCRLCSEMHRTVIHIYGDQGKRLGLVEKINGYLPITISPIDPLPKTICQSCLRRVEQHYDLLLRLSRIKEGRFLRIYKPVNREESSNASEDEFLTTEQLRPNYPRSITSVRSLGQSDFETRRLASTLSALEHEVHQIQAQILAEDENEEFSNANNVEDADDELEDDAAEENIAEYDEDDDVDNDDEEDIDEVDEEDIDEEINENRIDVDNDNNDRDNGEDVDEDDDDDDEERIVTYMQYDSIDSSDNIQRNSLTVQAENNVDTTTTAVRVEEEQEVIEDGIIDMERVEEEIIND